MQSIEINSSVVHQAACEEADVTLAHLLARDPISRRECFDSRSISFRAYVSPMEGKGTCLTYPIPGDEGLTMCEGPSRVLVLHPGDEDGLTAILPPDMAIEDVPTDIWVVATGHFNDAAAETCADGVEVCRMAFVLERVDPDGQP